MTTQVLVKQSLLREIEFLLKEYASVLRDRASHCGVDRGKFLQDEIRSIEAVRGKVSAIASHQS